jgi:hypothetical protein
MAQDTKFEVPQELRHLAEENVERARQLYLQFMDGVGQAMATWSSASSDVIAPGFREVQERAVKLANENADAICAIANEVVCRPEQEFGLTKALTDVRNTQSRQ